MLILDYFDKLNEKTLFSFLQIFLIKAGKKTIENLYVAFIGLTVW